MSDIANAITIASDTFDGVEQPGQMVERENDENGNVLLVGLAVVDHCRHNALELRNLFHDCLGHCDSFT